MPRLSFSSASRSSDRFAGGKGAAIALGELSRAPRYPRHAFGLAIMGAHRFLEKIVPGLDRLFDLMFQGVDIDIGAGAFIAPDDVMNAHQRAFIDHRRRGRHAAVQGPGENGVNTGPAFLGDAAQRRVEQRRDEAVETVETQEQFDLGPAAQFQNPHRGGEQLVLRNLEQFVAREGVENMRQRLGVMTGRRQPGAGGHRGDFLAQQGNGAGRQAVGAGGEQADKAMLADEIAVGPENLDPDIIHMGPAMHETLRDGFGDDQGLGLVQEGAHRGRQRRAFSGLGDHPRILVGQNAQPSAVHLGKTAMLAVFCQAIIARAQESEMIVGQPVQEGEVFCGLGGGIGAARRGQLVARRLEAPQHRWPVAYRRLALFEAGAETVQQLLARSFGGHRVQQQHDDADRCAVHRRDGMKSGSQADAGGNRGQERGIVKKRTVVIDRDQQLFRLAGIRPPTFGYGRQAEIDAARLVRAGRGEGAARQLRQGVRRTAQNIFRRGGGEQRREEIHQLRLFVFQEGAGLGQARQRRDLIAVFGAESRRIEHGKIRFASRRPYRSGMTNG